MNGTHDIRGATPRVGTRRRRQGGQALVFLAISLVAFIGTIGLVIDGGFAYVHRRQMQNAADAGSHDGTAILAAHYSTVCAYEAAARQAAVNAALANGAVQARSVTVGLTDVNGAPTATCDSARTMGVSVNVSQPYSTYFAGVLGITQISAGADAIAHYGFINGLTGALPVVLNLDSVPTNLTDGQAHAAVLSPAGGGGPGPVNFGTIDPTKYGQTLAEALGSGLTIPVVAGKGCGATPKPCIAGSINGFDAEVLKALQDRIDSARSETWTTHAPDSRRVVTLLVINGDIGNATVVPSGFALVFLDKVTGGNGTSGLWIHFISGSIVATGATIDYNINNATAGQSTPKVIRFIR
jgi:Flp pilus assembly protein TadG